MIAPPRTHSHPQERIGGRDRVGRTEISVAVRPAPGTAIQTLTPPGGSTEVDVHCGVQANTPFEVRRVAEAAEPIFGKALSLQPQEAEAWLASR